MRHQIGPVPTALRRGNDEIDAAASRLHMVFGRCVQIYFSVVQRKVVSPNDFHILTPAA